MIFTAAFQVDGNNFVHNIRAWMVTPKATLKIVNNFIFCEICLESYVYYVFNQNLGMIRCLKNIYKHCFTNNVFKFAQCLEVLANKTKLSLTPSATKPVINGYGITADNVSVKFLKRYPNMQALPTACSSCNSKLLAIVIKLAAAVRKIIMTV